MGRDRRRQISNLFETIDLAEISRGVPDLTENEVYLLLEVGYDLTL